MQNALISVSTHTSVSTLIVSDRRIDAVVVIAGVKAIGTKASAAFDAVQGNM